MSFPWEAPARTSGRVDHAQALTRELADRAALYYRLGVPAAVATARLAARVAWEFETAARAVGAPRRPASLDDTRLGKLVADVYARRPG